MKYILYDNIEGTILGLCVEKPYNTDDEWVTLSDEAYNYILENNSLCRVNADTAKLRTQKYKSSEDLTYCVIDMTAVITERIYDVELIIENMIRKNSTYCNMYIENGIHFTLDNGEKKKYTYKIEDQVNIEQLLRLIDCNIFNEKTGVPIKASEESEYDILSIAEFKKLYSALLRHKYYQLFYMRQYNEYIRTLTSEIELHKLQYGMTLPDKYISEINRQLENFQNI